MSEPLDLDGIEARANAASAVPMEWFRRPARGVGTSDEDWAEHIAGMDPATTLALVAEVRALRAKVEALLPEIEMWREHFLDEVREVEERNAAASSVEPTS